MNPKCPNCGDTMQGGAPHGTWTHQFECRRCNVYQCDTYQRPIQQPDDSDIEAALDFGRMIDQHVR